MEGSIENVLKESSTDDFLAFCADIEQRIRAQGGADSEFDTINYVRERVQAGQIDPKKGMEQLQQLFDNRQER